MAQTPTLTKIDRTLASVRLVVDDLPRVAEDWAEWDDDVQADFTLEWMGVMDHLTYVADQVNEGAASPSQRAAYAALQSDRRAAEPTLRALEVHVPPEIFSAGQRTGRRVPA